jgi:ribose transport system permease protein
MQTSTDDNYMTDAASTGGAGSQQARRKAVPQELIVLAALVAIVIIFGILNSAFLSLTNVRDTLQSSTEVGLLAIGELFVIISAGIDLSVGATLGLAGVLSALVVRDVQTLALAIIAAIATVLAVGIAVGLFNGLVITRLHITPFVATLGSLGVCSGLTLIITNGLDITGIPAALVSFGNSHFLGVLTGPIIVTVLLGAYAGWVLKSGIFGRWTYAVGSNALGALESGINVRRHVVKVYVLSSLCAAIGGFVLMARLGDGSPVSGANDELTAITAVVIGGASLFGGRGNMLGTLLGVLILSAVLDGLIIAGIQPYWQTVVTGLLLVAAVSLQTILRPARESDGMP